MDKIQPYINDVLDFAREGFANANGVLGLLIAAVAVFTMRGYNPRSVITTTVGATVTFLLVRMFVPVLDHNAPLRLPEVLASHFWREVGLLAVGLFVVISIFYVIKQTVLKSAGGGGGGGHH